MINNITIVGRIVRNPELKYIGDGMPVTTATVAVDRDYKNKDGTITTDFINIEVKFKPAEFVANYCTKGTLVGVVGALRIDNYTDKEGNKRSFTKIDARSVQKLSFDKDNKPAEPPATFDSIEDDEIPF